MAIIFGNRAQCTAASQRRGCDTQSLARQLGRTKDLGPSSLNCRHPRRHDTLPPARCMPASSVPASADELKAFWLTQGLAEWQAERLAGDQERRGGQYADPAWVSGRLAQLEAVLPGPVPPLLYEDSDLLDPTKGDPEKISKQLIVLREVLPGVDLAEIVAKQPRLLYMEGAQEKLGRVISKLVQLFPYKSGNKRAEVLKMVQEYPMLLVRMEYYLDDKKYRRVEDLPVDIQNNILRNYCG